MTAGRWVRGVAAGALLIVLLAAGAGWRWWTCAGDPGAEVVVRIPAGATSGAITDSLVSHDLLERRRAFLLALRWSGQEGRLQAGRFRMQQGAAPRDLARQLAYGATLPVVLTLIEGERVDQAAARIAQAFPLDPKVVAAAVDSAAVQVMRRSGWLPVDLDEMSLRRKLSAEAASRGRPFALGEGYLLPQTYHLSEGSDAAAVVGAAVHAGLDSLRALLEAGAADPRSASLSPHGVLTLASIVEAETPHIAEMPRVAAVYLNRLARGHALEADPTVAFALDKRGRRLFFKDLDVDSPFNTYRNPGLPPTPIGCPGAAALRAVLRPDPDPDVFYFVADGRGGHVFSNTWAEHERAVAAYRLRRGS